jgi:hypothetical protein
VLFTLLELPLNKVILKIKRGLNAKKLPEVAILTFPFDELLIASLQSSCADLAIEWLEQGYPLNDELRLVLCGNDKQSKIWLKAQRERLSTILRI